MLNHVLRYEPVLAELRPLLGGSLLEAGSGSEGVARFLGEEWTITAVDRSFDDYGRGDGGTPRPVTRVTGSVLALPFPDASFDAVLALDLLEHLEPGDRVRALEELSRVTRGTLVVGCPTGPAAERADRWLAGYVRRVLRRSPPGWLVEHLDHGLPPESIFAALGPRARVRGNEAALTHLLVCALESTPLLARGVLRWSRRWTEGPGALRLGAVPSPLLAALRLGDREPRYRTIAVLAAP